MAEKEGLNAAVEYTKLIITLDSGLIAFLTGTTFVARLHTGSEKLAIVAVLLLLGLSLCAGLVAYMRACTMLGSADYNLSDRYLSIPGMVNVVCFAVGVVGVGGLAVFELILKASG